MSVRYIFIAVRTLSKHLSFSIINVLGLSTALCAALLIALYARFELSFDQFHARADDIYRVATEVTMQDDIITRESNTYAGIIDALKSNSPEVEELTVISTFDSDNTHLRVQTAQGLVPFSNFRGLYADESFFRVFTFSFRSGDETFKPYSAVVSESWSDMYFNGDAIGKTIQFTDDDHGPKVLTVTGVMENVPANSHLRFDIVMHVPRTSDNFWDWLGHTYARLKPGSDVQVIEDRLNALAAGSNALKRNKDDYGRTSRFTLQPLTDIHLYSNLESEPGPPGNALLVYLMISAAIVIMIVAWINYANLSTAMHIARARQYAIRKVIGASWWTLIRQAFTESFVLNAWALTLGAIGAALVFPAFARLVSLDAHTLDFSFRDVLILLVLFLLISTAASGLYPALSIAGMKPLTGIKGSTPTGKASVIQRSLVIIQFGVAIILIMTSIVAHRQLAFMQERDLGIDIEQVLVLKALNFDQESWSDNAGGYVIDQGYQQRAQLFLDDLHEVGDVVNAGSLSHLPGQMPNWGTEFTIKDSALAPVASLKAIGVDYGFIDALGIRLLAGRNFSPAFLSDRGDEMKRAVVINDAASRVLGFRTPKHAVSRHISTYWDADYEVIGVVQSFHQMSLKEELVPLYFILHPRALSYFAIDIHTQDVITTVSNIKSIWSRHFPGYPFDYFFLDDYFNRQYLSDISFAKTMRIFTGLAIFIGCIGLLGLTSHSVARRTKEIGIRKVLGASAASVVGLFSSDLIKLILIATALALPLAYAGLSVWLNNYAYRTSLTWWMFVLPMVTIWVLAFATVSLQVMGVAMKSPINSLKQE